MWQKFKKNNPQRFISKKLFLKKKISFIKHVAENFFINPVGESADSGVNSTIAAVLRTVAGQTDQIPSSIAGLLHEWSAVVTVARAFSQAVVSSANLGFGINLPYVSTISVYHDRYLYFHQDFRRVCAIIFG